LIDEVTDKNSLLDRDEGFTFGLNRRSKPLFAESINFHNTFIQGAHSVDFTHAREARTARTEAGNINQTQKGDINMKVKDAQEPKVRSAWANGSFYLFLFAVVIAGLGVLARSVPLEALGIILIAAVIFVPIIGALQLRQDGRLSEKSFLELMKLSIGQLPLIGNFFNQFFKKDKPQ
jgi:hypothetical protein